MESAQCTPVVRHTVVAVVAPQHAGEPLLLLGQRCMHIPRHFLAQRLRLAVVRTPVLLTVIVAPRPPTEGLVPRLPKLTRTPGMMGTDFRNPNDMAISLKKVEA
jgi:hypothetical protein